jgi:ribosomal-protein-alanine N-acetyltransferase
MDAKRLFLFPYAPEYLRILASGPDEELSDFMSNASDEFLKRLQASLDRELWALGFAVVERQTQAVIGVASFKGPPNAERLVEISYGITAGFRKRGYATEAVKMLLDLAAKSGRVSRVIAHTVPSNEASKRVLEKCGFTLASEELAAAEGPVLRWERSTAGF